uniref:Uncharacterized protein n=1 Tax=Populus trichocarpa TaxID=3694 RepID=A9P836_POPTR|nr:unknown [Populus trichocarpa]
MKACFAFNASIQCFLIRPWNHLKDLPQERKRQGEEDGICEFVRVSRGV